jgi:hypothetical protein
MAGSFDVSKVRFTCEAMTPLKRLILGELLRQFFSPLPRRSLPQRRKGAKRYRVSKGFLCAFAPLREKYFLSPTAMRTFRASPLEA